MNSEQWTAPAEWDRERVLDVAASARTDAYAVCGHSAVVERIATELCDADAELNLLREQLLAERAERNRLATLHAKVSAENLALRKHMLAMSMDRLAYAATGMDSATLSATLDAQVDAMVAAGIVPDKEVVDPSGIDEIAADRTPTRHLEPISAAQLMAGRGGRS